MERAVAGLLESGVVDHVVVAVPADRIEQAQQLLAERATVVAGGLIYALREEPNSSDDVVDVSPEETTARAEREAEERTARAAEARNATNQTVALLPDRDESLAEDVPSPWANAAIQSVQQGDIRVRVTGLRADRRSAPTNTSTPTWIPVRTPSAAPNFAIQTNM